MAYQELQIYTDGGARGNPGPSSLRFSLKPLGFNISATGNSRFPTPSLGPGLG
jgi:ribonuclease HI